MFALLRRYSTNTDAIKMLVANKVDQEQKVSKADGEEFAFANSMLFIETSAKTRKGARLLISNFIASRFAMT